MNHLFRPYLRKFVIVFFDDILIYSPTIELHLQQLTLVFATLSEAKFTLKFSKCQFLKCSIEYLGHIVSSKGVEPVPSKIDAMIYWPIPSTLKQLHGFLGLTGFYRRFIKNYASLSFHLTELLKKDAFIWSPNAQLSDNLKKALTHTPVLALPDFTKSFVLQTDALGAGLGAVLTQNGHPISFFSKKFTPKLLNSSTYVRELHAISEAVQKWQHYLFGNKFFIETDQKSLKELMNQVIQTPAQHYYFSKLLGYDYVILYKPDKSNIVTDALSRRNTPDSSQLILLTTPTFEFLRVLLQENKSHPDMLTLHKEIQNGSARHPDFSIHNDILYFKGKPYLG